MMKFFEFNHTEYYALIGAESIDSVMDYYEETVADSEESDGFPDEITKLEAKLKLCDACEKTKENIWFITAAFEENVTKNTPFMILVDGSLI